MNSTGGVNTRYRRTTASTRKEIGKKTAPPVVNPPDHSKDERNYPWAREAAAQVLRSDWSKVADGYDPSCGMQDTAEWRRAFLHIMYDEMKADEKYLLGFKWAAEAYFASIQVQVSTLRYYNAKKAPVPPMPKKEKPLTYMHQRIVGQLGGNTDVCCPGCGKDLAPRFEEARKLGTCPAVFVWSQDGRPYCGPCFGKLPYPKPTNNLPAEPRKPGNVAPKVDPKAKLYPKPKNDPQKGLEGYRNVFEKVEFSLEK